MGTWLGLSCLRRYRSSVGGAGGRRRRRRGANTAVGRIGGVKKGEGRWHHQGVSRAGRGRSGFYSGFNWDGGVGAGRVETGPETLKRPSFFFPSSLFFGRNLQRACLQLPFFPPFQICPGKEKEAF